MLDVTTPTPEFVRAAEDALKNLTAHPASGAELHLRDNDTGAYSISAVDSTRRRSRTGSTVDFPIRTP